MPGETLTCEEFAHVLRYGPPQERRALLIGFDGGSALLGYPPASHFKTELKLHARGGSPETHWAARCSEHKGKLLERNMQPARRDEPAIAALAGLVASGYVSTIVVTDPLKALWLELRQRGVPMREVQLDAWRPERIGLEEWRPLAGPVCVYGGDVIFRYSTTWGIPKLPDLQEMRASFRAVLSQFEVVMCWGWTDLNLWLNKLVIEPGPGDHRRIYVLGEYPETDTVDVRPFDLVTCDEDGDGEDGDGPGHGGVGGRPPGGGDEGVGADKVTTDILIALGQALLGGGDGRPAGETSAGGAGEVANAAPAASPASAPAPAPPPPPRPFGSFRSLLVPQQILRAIVLKVLEAQVSIVGVDAPLVRSRMADEVALEVQRLGRDLSRPGVVDVAMVGREVALLRCRDRPAVAVAELAPAPIPDAGLLLEEVKRWLAACEEADLRVVLLTPVEVSDGLGRMPLPTSIHAQSFQAHLNMTSSGVAEWIERQVGFAIRSEPDDGERRLDELAGGMVTCMPGLDGPAWDVLHQAVDQWAAELEARAVATPEGALSLDEAREIWDGLAGCLPEPGPPPGPVDFDLGPIHRRRQEPPDFTIGVRRRGRPR